MRKKSHISLARSIVYHSDDSGLKKHKWAFYLGSILPDIKPSFLYRKHEFNGTFEQVRRKIFHLAKKGGKQEERRTNYYRNLGQVIHYTADYFTFPHNEVYSGSLKDHYSYEEKLKQRLREYLRREQLAEEHRKKREFVDEEALCDFIRESHEEYLKQKIDIDEDIRYIVSLNYQVVEGIKQLADREQ